MSNPIHVTDAEFETAVLKSSSPVLLDFWAEWCAPCRGIAPILDELATEYAGKVTIAKLDIQNNPKTPATYSIRSIPTLILFKDGQIVDTVIGAVSKASLVELIEKAL